MINHNDRELARRIVDLLNDQGDNAGQISDGFHTFDELYDHRRALTAALCKALSLDSWRSKAHHPDDSPMFEGGYFIVGINLPTGTITYHYELSHWDDFAGVIELGHAPKWDGAPPAATVDRLLGWARGDSVPAPGATFMDDLRAGRTTVSKIDDYVEVWHKAPYMPKTLPEFLGLTMDQYKIWFDTGKIPLPPSSCDCIGPDPAE